MPSLFTMALAAAGVAVAIFLIYGLASRWRSLPCPSWLGWMVEMDNPFTKTNRAHEIISHLRLTPGMAILDAGCGPGRLAIPLAKALQGSGHVLALDLQEAMLERVREKARTEKLDGVLSFLRAGLGEGKLPHAAFDRALLVTVLGEIPDRKAALAELFAALKPGGILSVTEVVFDPHFQTQGPVRRMAAQAGFTETALFGSRIAYTMHFEKPDWRHTARAAA
jgi:ubiquinone/menaquinone biosynthesis C-methylase UbiE